MNARNAGRAGAGNSTAASDTERLDIAKLRTDIDTELSALVLWTRMQHKGGNTAVPDWTTNGRVIAAAWHARRGVYRRKFHITGDFPTATLLPTGRRRKARTGYSYTRAYNSSIDSTVADEMRGLVVLNRRSDSPDPDLVDLGGVVGDILVPFLVKAATKYNDGNSFSGKPLPAFPESDGN